MLGEKKTVPLWRRRRPKFLEMERARAGDARTARDTDMDCLVIGRKAALRRAAEAKGRMIRPPA